MCFIMLLTRLGAQTPGMMAVSRMITASFVFRSRAVALVLSPIFRCNASPILRKQHNGQPGQRCLAQQVSCFRMVVVLSLILLELYVLLRNVVLAVTICGPGHQQTMACPGAAPLAYWLLQGVRCSKVLQVQAITMSFSSMMFWVEMQSAALLIPLVAGLR